MKCSFCSAEIEKGKGLMYVKRDGTSLYFCSGKCKKHTLKLKRKARLTKWVYKPAKGKK
jgi:large subunit ribosomal protein L24e